MKQLFFALLLVFVFSVTACTNNSIRGVYVCDNSNKKPDTTTRSMDYTEVFIDLTCTVTTFDFKGKSTVEMILPNGKVVSSYVIDEDYIRIKGTGSDILLKRQDKNTLIGEGVFQGVYQKK